MSREKKTPELQILPLTHSTARFQVYSKGIKRKFPSYCSVYALGGYHLQNLILLQLLWWISFPTSRWLMPRFKVFHEENPSLKELNALCVTIKSGCRMHRHLLIRFEPKLKGSAVEEITHAQATSADLETQSAMPARHDQEDWIWPPSYLSFFSVAS